MKRRMLRILYLLPMIIYILTAGVVYAQPDASPAEFDGMYELPASPSVEAPSAILTESKRGQILFEKNSSEKLHISAACKIMTSLLVIEKSKGVLDAKVTISKESVDAEGSALNLIVGEKYSVEDLLYAVMLRSANDAANALAEYTGGDIQNFVTFMNDKATELNLKDTHFSNPTGLFDESQYTTAYDISLLIKYAISNPIFNKIFSSMSRPWTDASGKTDIIVNQNDLFWAYDGVDGGKTGFNNMDQHTAITTATRGNQRLICIILDSPKGNVFTDSQKLLDYGFNNFRTGILVKKGEPLKNVQIGDKQVNLISMNDVYYTYPIGENYIKSYEINISKGLVLPVKKSLSIGTARYILNDDTVVDISLYPDNDIYPPEDFVTSTKKKILENKDILYLLIFLAAVEGILIIYNLIKLISRIFRKVFLPGKKDM